MIEAVTDEGFFPNDRNPSQDATAAEHTLNVSVISLGGEVLIIVPVSARSSVWELKGLIEKSVPEKHMKARWMMLMPGPQVLPDAASLHDAGVVDGTTLSIIVAPTYKLLVRTESGNIELWNQEGKHEGTVLPTPNGLQGAVFSPDNTLFLTLEAVSTKLWRVDTQECLFVFSHVASLISAAFSPTGTTVLSASGMNDAKLWSVNSGQCINTVQLSRDGHIMTAFTAHGGMVLHSCGRWTALWNVETGARVWEYPLNGINCRRGWADFSACGDWFFTIRSADDVRRNTVDVWGVSGCSHYRQLQEPTGKITSARFTPDAWRVLTVSERNAVTVWSLGRDWACYTFHHKDLIRSAAFSSDGDQVLTISGSDAWLWITDSQTPGLRLRQINVARALFTPDGNLMLVSRSHGITVRSATDRQQLCWADADKHITVVIFSN